LGYIAGLVGTKGRLIFRLAPALGIRVKVRHSLLSISAAMIAATLGTNATGAEETSATLSPQAQQEIAQVEAEIDRIEAQTIERLAMPPVTSDVDACPSRAAAKLGAVSLRLADGIEHDHRDLALGLALVIGVGRPEL
jgi:hypothetical protein